jgi:hypothetical protein
LRWRETGNAWPHGANALKYVMSLLVIWFSTWSRISGLLEARILWIVFAALSASYSYFWDVYYDWGLWRNLNIHGKHFLLRDELRYAPAAIYYVAMVLNAFLRINWIFLISPSYWGILIDGRILAILFAILEVYRRFQWNLFRMENEHLNNWWVRWIFFSASDFRANERSFIFFQWNVSCCPRHPATFSNL